LFDRAEMLVENIDDAEPVDQLSERGTPADPVSDTSGMPNRTRFLPRLRLRNLATQKVPLP